MFKLWNVYRRQHWESETAFQIICQFVQVQSAQIWEKYEIWKKEIWNLVIVLKGRNSEIWREKNLNFDWDSEIWSQLQKLVETMTLGQIYKTKLNFWNWVEISGIGLNYWKNWNLEIYLEKKNHEYSSRSLVTPIEV